MPILNIPDKGSIDIKESIETQQELMKQQHQEMMEVLSSINDNLKILNTYMALITNHRIGDE